MSANFDALTVIAVVDLLRANPEGVPLAELAERFQLTPDEMRDVLWHIWTLAVKDETGYDDPATMFEFDATAFDEDWIVLTHDPARTAPVRYTATEQATVTLGLEILRAGATRSERAHIDPLLAKLRGTEPAVPAASRTADPREAQLTAAIDAGRRVRIRYRAEDGDGMHWRTVEPLRLVNHGASSYLNAWCRLREGLRWFRLDRIHDLELTDEPSDAHTEAERDRPLEVHGRGLTRVELLVAPAARSALTPYVRGRLPRPDAAGFTRVTVPLRSWRVAARLVGENPGSVTVLGPAEVRDAVREWARAARAKLEIADTESSDRA